MIRNGAAMTLMLAACTTSAPTAPPAPTPQQIAATPPVSVPIPAAPRGATPPSDLAAEYDNAREGALAAVSVRVMTHAELARLRILDRAAHVEMTALERAKPGPGYRQRLAAARAAVADLAAYLAAFGQ